MSSRHFFSLCFALLLTGCSAPTQPTGDNTEHMEPAPTWTAGEWWLFKHDRSSDDGNISETINWTMLEQTDVSGRSVYVIQESTAAGTRERRFTVDDLHELVDQCTERAPQQGCSWEQSELDFPLFDGKTWQARYRSVTYDARTDRTSGDDWNVTLTFGPVSTIAIVFDASVGIWTQRTETTDSLLHIRDSLTLMSCSRSACETLREEGASNR